MRSWWQDLRFSCRTLLRSPGFTLSSVVILGLGIAATTAVTSVVVAVLVHRVPYDDPDRLLFFDSFKQEPGGTREAFPASYLDYRDWRTRSKVFEDVGVYPSGSYAFNLLSAGEPERVSGEIVSASYFRLLRVKPVLGRTFAPEDDDRPGEPAIVVLGHALWQRRFGRDPRVLGKSLVLDGNSYEIVGVMPPRFRGLSDEAEVWLPLTMSQRLLGNSRFLDRRGVRWLAAIARLKPGVELRRAQQEIDAVNAGLAREYPDTDEHMGVRLRTLADWLFVDLRFSLLTLLGASLFVLLIAWTTVANLLLARAKARQREIALRDALGATRLQLLRQLVTESLVLAGASCLLGLLLAGWTTGLLVALSAVKFQSFVKIGLNAPVVAVIVALSVACGLAFGLTPGWLGLRGGFLALRQKGAAGSIAAHRFQSALVMTEIALALFLLIGAALLIQSFRRSQRVPLGFDPANLLTVRVDLKNKGYADGKTMIRLAHSYRDRLAAVPGVGSVAIEGPGMPTDPWAASSFVIEDLLARTKEGAAYMVFHHVTPGYFHHLGIPLLQGRDFSEADSDSSPLAIIISQAAAAKYWPHESPLGKRMRFGKRDPNAPWLTVVGVVGDLNQPALQATEWPGPDVYFDVFQFPPLLTPQLNFLIRPRDTQPLRLAPRVERALRVIAPQAPPFDVDTMQHRLDQFSASRRFTVLLISLFAGLALLLAAIGLYSVLFHAVTQRTRELGIRVALGAQRRDLLTLVVGEAARLAATGLAIGLLAAVAFNRLFRSMLYGVSPLDLATLTGATLLLFTVALLATLIPARRVFQIPPTTALRAE